MKHINVKHYLVKGTKLGHVMFDYIIYPFITNLFTKPLPRDATLKFVRKLESCERWDAMTRGSVAMHQINVRDNPDQRDNPYTRLDHSTFQIFYLLLH